MKGENCDVNNVERANIPKFSKLDDIVIPLSLKLFFDAVLVAMIDGCTMLYSQREKANISFEITNEKVHLFLSMLLLSGCRKLPTVECIGRQPPDTFV